MQHRLRKLTYSLRRTLGVRNPWQAAIYIFQRVRGAAGHGRYALEPRHFDHPFDAEYGIQTSGLIAADPADDTRYAYYGVSPSVFDAVCRRWQATLPPGKGPEDYTFIDLGAGMGRALFLAAHLPFRRVMGVEVESKLVQIGRRNIASWMAAGRARSSIEIVEEDARQFTFPDGPLLIFLYNPFSEEILQQVLDRLASIRSAPAIDVLYVYPVFGYLLEQRADFQRLWLKLIPLDPSDAAVDAFRSTSETCAAYRLKPGRHSAAGTRPGSAE